MANYWGLHKCFPEDSCYEQQLLAESVLELSLSTPSIFEVPNAAYTANPSFP
jgi:hypothetical protein